MRPGQLAAFVIATLTIAACGGPAPSPRSATEPSPATAATANPAEENSASETTIAGREDIRLTIGEPVALPANLIIYWSPKRQNADGSGHRLFRTSVGDLTTTTTALYTFLPTHDAGAYASDLIADWAAGTLVVSVCVEGFCGGGPGIPTEDARTVLFRSDDAGTTWNAWGDLEQGQQPAGILDGEVVMVSENVNQAGEPTGTYRQWLYPSGTPLQPPSPLAKPWAWFPIVGGPIWHELGVNTTDLLDASGHVIVNSSVGSPVPDLEGGLRFLQGFRNRGEPLGSDVARLEISRLPPNSAQYSLPLEEASLNVVIALDEFRLLGNATMREPGGTTWREYAVLVDLQRGTVHPLTELSRGLDAQVTPVIRGVRLRP